MTSGLGSWSPVELVILKSVHLCASLGRHVKWQRGVRTHVVDWLWQISASRSADDDNDGRCPVSGVARRPSWGVQGRVCRLCYFYLEFLQRVADLNILQMKKTGLNQVELRSESISRDRRWLRVTCCEEVGERWVWKWDWALGLVVMRSSETSGKVSFSPVTRARAGLDEVEKGRLVRRIGGSTRTHSLGIRV